MTCSHPMRPPSASVIRIGTENVRSFPYRAAMASVSVCAPRAFSSHALDRATACPKSPSARAAPNAAQHSAVVLMLLLLCTVSPQPPSAFCVCASHFNPPRIKPPSASRPTCASATTAVAVESALLESSPTQCPAAVSSASSASVTTPSAPSPFGCPHCAADFSPSLEFRLSPFT